MAEGAGSGSVGGEGGREVAGLPAGSDGVGMAAALGPGVMRRQSRMDHQGGGGGSGSGSGNSGSAAEENGGSGGGAGGEQTDKAGGGGGQLTIARTTAGVEWSRPLTPEWAVTFGSRLEKVGVRGACQASRRRTKCYTANTPRSGWGVMTYSCRATERS